VTGLAAEDAAALDRVIKLDPDNAVQFELLHTVYSHNTAVADQSIYPHPCR
jgi:hypothetical protein